MNWTLLAFIGGSAGTLAFTGITMALLPGLSAPGDTPSVELAAALIGASLAVAGAGAGLAVGARWARPVSLLVALGCLAVGVYGLVASFLIVAYSLATAVSGAALMLMAGAAGVVLLMARRATTGIDERAPSGWLERVGPLVVGVLVGFGVAWIWAVFIATLLDAVPCCQQ